MFAPCTRLAVSQTFSRDSTDPDNSRRESSTFRFIRGTSHHDATARPAFRRHAEGNPRPAERRELARRDPSQAAAIALRWLRLQAGAPLYAGWQGIVSDPRTLPGAARRRSRGVADQRAARNRHGLDLALRGAPGG